MIYENVLLFKHNELKTPNSYDRNFMYPTNNSGVYFIVRPYLSDCNLKFEYDILYIGSSNCLHERYKRHEVLRILNEVYGYVQFYFKEIDNYIEVEKATIKHYQPKYNKQWR